MCSQVYRFLGEEMGYGLTVTTQSGLSLTVLLPQVGLQVWTTMHVWLKMTF